MAQDPVSDQSGLARALRREHEHLVLHAGVGPRQYCARPSRGIDRRGHDSRSHHRRLGRARRPCESAARRPQRNTSSARTHTRRRAAA